MLGTQSMASTKQTSKVSKGFNIKTQLNIGKFAGPTSSQTDDVLDEIDS